MKKLMFAAVAAAMIGGVEAAGLVDCFGVYDFTATLKTTKGVMANLKAKSNPCIEADATAYVRKQATVKVQGLIWGCDCDFTAEPRPFSGWEIAWDGSAFWNATDRTGYDVFGDEDYNTLKWIVLNRIDTTAKKTEGFWTLDLAAYDEGEVVTEFALYGAGFGTAAGDLVGACGNSHVYVPSMSGYVVGSRQYSCLSDKKTWAVCNDDPKEETYVLLWWSLCDCEVDVSALTIAYGSWTLKFNQSLANSGANNVKKGKAYYESIRNKVPAYLRDAMDLYPPEESAECIEARANVKTAQAAYDAAKTADDAALVAVNKAIEGVADVTWENLTAELKAAKETLAQALVQSNSCAKAYGATNAIYIASKDDYNDQMDYVTNRVWSITFVNKSGDEIEITDATSAKTLVAFKAANEEVKGYTIRNANYGGYPIEPATYANIAKFVAEAEAKTVALKSKMDANAANLATAKAAYDAAKQAVVYGEKAVAEAQNRLDNITYLQAEAQRKLLEAESKKSQTSAALTTANTVLAAAKIAEANACN